MIEFKRLDHLQICIPLGKENEARSFYTNILGLKEIPKPLPLVQDGGLWYVIGDIQLHIGTEGAGKEMNQSKKRHLAFEVSDLEASRIVLEKHRVEIRNEKPLPGIKRFSVIDPFDNRIELLEVIEFSHGANHGI
jgi:catechol 2,3-dioxygenase-like lactoylglutathione lyase family enzyme